MVLFLFKILWLSKSYSVVNNLPVQPNAMLDYCLDTMAPDFLAGPAELAPTSISLCQVVPPTALLPSNPALKSPTSDDAYIPSQRRTNLFGVEC